MVSECLVVGRSIPSVLLSTHSKRFTVSFIQDQGPPSNLIIFVISEHTLIFINPERHENPISGSKVTAILLKGVDFAYWWSCIKKGLCLQPTYQACLNIFNRPGVAGAVL